MRSLIAVLLFTACGAAPQPAAPQPAAPLAAAPEPSVVSAEASRLRSPSEPRPFAIDAPRSLTWTNIWDTAFSTADGRNGGYVIERSRNPVLAQAAAGDIYAAVVFDHRVTLTLVRLSAEHRVDTVELPWTGAAAAAAIALDQRTAKVMVLGGPNHLIAVTVDLATAKVTGHTELTVDAARFSLGKVFRSHDGWVAVGLRRGTTGRRNRDAVAWSIGDRATALGSPVTVAVAPAEYEYEEVDGDVAPNGDVMIRAKQLRSDPPTVAGEQVIAVRRGGRWTRLAMPSSEQSSRAAADADSRWLIACWWGCDDKPGIHALGDPASRRHTTASIQAPIALDTAWLGGARNRMRTFVAGRNVYVYGGDVTGPTRPRHADGAIYDLAHRTARPFTSPAIPGLPDASWQPRAGLTIGEQLCLSGGVAFSSTAGRSVEIHGAACLDPASLTWQWHASPATPYADPRAIGNGCAVVRQLAPSTTLVGCANRTYLDAPPTNGHPGYSGWGPFKWSVWIVNGP